MTRHIPTLLACVALAAVTPAAAQNVTITNARIIVSNGTVIERGSIVVRDGKIASVAAGAPAARSGQVIDAKGMTAVPGYIDAHKHINTGPNEKADMADLIEAGFTTVLSGGGPGDGNQTLIQHIESGQIVGPRVLASERVNLRGTPEEARAAIRAMAAKGIRNTGEIAVTPEPGPPPAEIEVLKAAVDEGAKVGVQVNVHAVSTPAMMAATEAGVRRQVHLPNKDFMSYDDADAIVKSGTIVLDLISFGAPIIDVFAKDDLPRFRTGMPWPDSIAGANRDAKGRATGTEGAYTLINARRIWDASKGTALGYGSDQNYPVKDVLEHELKSLAVMFSMPDIFRIIGPNTAAYLNMSDQIGTLEAGKLGDIVLLDGNPLTDFHDMLKAKVVLKAGKVVVDKR
ncbi:MAG TPA: amidohydrolase family protein [Caulobacteraceae bacterium]|jgi:imidazolonepropionase-like amidohydrolase|nr:amidohydrolase family protein [Caulobacteraceae bacterium]